MFTLPTNLLTAAFPHLNAKTGFPELMPLTPGQWIAIGIIAAAVTAALVISAIRRPAAQHNPPEPDHTGPADCDDCDCLGCDETYGHGPRCS